MPQCDDGDLAGHPPPTPVRLPWAGSLWALGTPSSRLAAHSLQLAQARWHSSTIGCVRVAEVGT